jgi:glutaredoxin
MVVDVYVKPEPKKKSEECRQCIMTEKIMVDKDVEYNRHVITDADAEKFRGMGLMSAPVVLVHTDGELTDSWAGFRPDKIGGLLA